MKRLKGILIVLLIFVCGVFVGGAVGGSAALMDLVNKTIRGGPTNVRKLLVQRAKHDLKLDDDQNHQFWQILNETGIELRDATKPVRPKIDAALAKSASRLRAILKPAQQPRFDSFVKDFRQRWLDALGESPAPANPPDPPVQP